MCDWCYGEVSSCQEYGHEFESVASWPSGPDGEWTELRKCKDCGDTYEEEHDSGPQEVL